MSRPHPENITPELIDPLDEIPAESNELLITTGQWRLHKLAKRALEQHTDGQNERLSLEREQELYKIIQDGQTAQNFLDEVTEGERKRYAKQVRQLEASVAAGTAAEKELFECNIDFARYFARTSMNIGKEKNGEDDDESTPSKPEAVGAYGDIRNLRSPYASLEDRTQIALMGLLDAVRKSKPGVISKKTKKPAKFVTFAAYHIHAALSREAIETENPGAYISADMRQKISNARKYPEDIPPHKLEHIVSAYRMTQATPLDTLPSNVYAPEEEYNEDIMLPLEDIIADQNQGTNPVYEVEQTELQKEVAAVLATLSEREAGVIRLRFGLVDGIPRALDEIGAVYGISRERVRQIENKTMTKLRMPTRSGRLTDFLIEDSPLPLGGPFARPEVAEGIVNIHHEELLNSERELEPLERDDAAQLRAIGREGLESWQASSDDTWDMPVFVPPTGTHEKEADANKLFVSILKSADPADFRQTDDVASYPKETIADLLTTCGEHLRPHHIESYWNNKIETFIATMERANRFDFSLNRVALLFSALLAETMKDDDDVVELDIPRRIDGQLNFMGAGLRHGKVIVNGDVGDYAGYRMQDLGQLHINGSTGDFTGAHCRNMASLTVTGDAGKDFAYGASNEVTFKVGGEINSLAIMPGFNGEIIAGSIKNKSIALKKSAQNIFPAKQ